MSHEGSFACLCLGKLVKEPLGNSPSFMAHNAKVILCQSGPVGCSGLTSVSCNQASRPSDFAAADVTVVVVTFTLY